MKKILLFLGSPRLGGNTERLADAFMEGATEKGHQCEKIRLAALSIGPCKACTGCWKNGLPCLQKDDMQEIYPKIETADVLVFASPLYYFGFSAQMKCLIDRFYSFEKKPELIHKKETVLLAAGADSEIRSFDGMLAMYRNCCSYLEWIDRGQIVALNTWNPGDVTSSGNWLAQAKEIGKSIS